VKGADLAVEAAAKVAVVVRRAVAADKVAAGARRAAAVVVEVDPEDLVEVVADRVAGARVAADRRVAAVVAVAVPVVRVAAAARAVVADRVAGAVNEAVAARVAAARVAGARVAGARVAAVSAAVAAVDRAAEVVGGVAAVEVREATGNRQRNSHDERLTLSESGALFLPGVRSGILGTGLTSDLRRHLPLVVTAVTWHPGGGTRRSNELKAWTRRETQAATC
jgi:hypothetical protein